MFNETPTSYPYQDLSDEGLANDRHYRTCVIAFVLIAFAFGAGVGVGSHHGQPSQSQLVHQTCTDSAGVANGLALGQPATEDAQRNLVADAVRLHVNNADLAGKVEQFVVDIGAKDPQDALTDLSTVASACIALGVS